MFSQEKIARKGLRSDDYIKIVKKTIGDQHKNMKKHNHLNWPIWKLSSEWYVAFWQIDIILDGVGGKHWLSLENLHEISVYNISSVKHHFQADDFPLCKFDLVFLYYLLTFNRQIWIILMFSMLLVILAIF